VLKGPDVADTKLTGVLDIACAVALAAATACTWLSAAGTDPPQLQTMAAAATMKTMNRVAVIAGLGRGVILPSWSPTITAPMIATDVSRRWNQSDHRSKDTDSLADSNIPRALEAVSGPLEPAGLYSKSRWWAQ
jgi:hypothetical protein